MRPITRRQVLRGLLLGFASGAASGLLSACAGGTTPSPTSTATASQPTAGQPMLTPTGSSSGVGAAATPSPFVTPTVRIQRTLRVVTGGAVSDAGLFIAIERGYFRDLGVSVQLDTSGAGGSGEVIPLLASGQVDISGRALAAALVNAVLQGIRVPVVADKGQLRRGVGFHALAVSKKLFDNGTVKTIAQLRGQKIALQSGDSAMEIVEIAKVLQTAGLTPRDIEVTTIRPSDMIPALQNASVAAANLAEPTATIAIDQQGVATALLRGDSYVDILGNGFPIAGLIFAPSIVQDRALTVGLLAAYLKAVRVYNQAVSDPSIRNEVIDILIKYTTLKDRPLYDKMVWPGLAADGRFDTSFLEQAQDLWLARGAIKQKVPIDQLVDFSFLEDAAKQL